jgi:hypothetical protein
MHIHRVGIRQRVRYALAAWQGISLNSGASAVTPVVVIFEKSIPRDVAQYWPLVGFISYLDDHRFALQRVAKRHSRSARELRTPIVRHVFFLHGIYHYGKALPERNSSEYSCVYYRSA